MILEFVTLSLFLSLYLYICRKCSFPIRTGSLFETYAAGRTSALLGHWWADRKLGWARKHHEARGSAEVVPFSGPHTLGDPATRVLACSWPLILLPAPAALCILHASPFPRGLCWLLWVHSEGQLRSGRQASGIHEAQSEGLGPSLRKAPPSGERGKTGSASDEKDIRWCRWGEKKRLGPAMAPETGWSTGIAAGEDESGALWEPSFSLSAHFIIPEVRGRIRDCISWGPAFRVKVGSWSLSTPDADRQAVGLWSGLERFWRN